MTKQELLQAITAYQVFINDFVNITEEQLELLHKSITPQT